MTRRDWMALATALRPVAAQPKPALDESALVEAGTRAALERSLIPALRERAYPGHFTITADGKHYGAENTWPGLDSWQMAGAYLLAGRRREVLDYFDFVEASQRPDGNIPFAIFPGDKPPGGLKAHLRGMRYPEDVYTYQPVKRSGQPAYSNIMPRKWIGLFVHWQVKANPLSVLGPVSYVLTGSELFANSQDKQWLKGKIASLESAGGYLASRISSNGLLSGAGFYIESPPRNQWDGVTQCYGVHSFRVIAGLCAALGRRDAQRSWLDRAATLASRFHEVFWKLDHFAEYVHPERGLVDSHGLSDVNWAAIGLGVATAEQTRKLWPVLAKEPAFWRGQMPTHLVTRPEAYEKWEYSEPLPFEYTAFTNDVAAMGRVWYLEALACVRMRAHLRLREGVVKVCRMGQKHDWLWHERYHSSGPDAVKPGGSYGYCEYPAILVRAVLGNPGVFPEARRIHA